MPDRIDRPPNVTIGTVEARGRAAGTAHRSLGGRVAQGIADGAAAVHAPQGAAARIDIADLRLRLTPGAGRRDIVHQFREALAEALREKEERG